MSRQRAMALAFAVGSACFLVGPFPGYAELVGETRRCDHLLRRLDLLHAGRRAPDARSRSMGAMSEAPGEPRGGARSSSRPARCSSTCRPSAPWTRRSRTRSTTGSSGGRMRSARCASWSRARSPTAPRHGTGGCPRAGRTAGGSRRSTCSAASSSASRRSPATSSPPRGSVLDLAAANWNTCLGAACFLACAVGTLLRRTTPRRGWASRRTTPRRPTLIGRSPPGSRGHAGMGASSRIRAQEPRA